MLALVGSCVKCKDGYMASCRSRECWIFDFTGGDLSEESSLGRTVFESPPQAHIAFYWATHVDAGVTILQCR